MDKRDTLPEIGAAGRALLSKFEFANESRHVREDYELGVLVRFCLAGVDGVPIARGLLRKLRESIDAHDARANDYDDLVRELFKVHPLEMFDELFVGDEQAQRRGIRLIEELMRHNKNPIDVVSDDAVITWCSGDPNSRYPLATAAVTLFRRPNDKSDHEWTPLASKLVRHAPEPMAVLDCIIARLHPTSWSGSLAAKLESRAKLLAQLDVGTNPELTRAVSEARAGLMKDAEACRRAETEEDRARSGRFE